MENYILVIAFLSVTVNLALMYFSIKKGIFLDKINKKHGIHKRLTPRIGGVGIAVSSIGMVVIPEGLLFFLSSLPIFLIGFLEDLKSDINPKVRLGFMTTSSILSIALLGAIVRDIDYIHFPFIIALVFTIVGLIGVVNAINIIDGLNGLASGIAILAFLSFSYVFYQYEDYSMMFISLILAAATVGFFVLNYPRGLIFLGDSGSYFLGFSLAVLSVLMVNRHNEVSAWFPLLLLVYPVWEVLFSMFRRKFLQKRGMMEPDRLHLHCLLCKRVLNSNPKSSFIILLSVFTLDLFAVNFRENSVLLTVAAFSFAIIYTFFYLSIVAFKVKLLYFKKIGMGIYRLVYIYKLFL